MTLFTCTTIFVNEFNMRFRRRLKNIIIYSKPIKFHELHSFISKINDIYLRTFYQVTFPKVAK